MNELREKEIVLPGLTVIMGTGEWATAENWVCPVSNYIVGQRLSDGHSPVRINAGNPVIREAYSHVRSLGFMPSASCIKLYPLGQPLRTLNCFFEKDYFEATTEMDTDGWYEYTGPFMTITNRYLEAMMQRIHAEVVQPGFGSDQVIEAVSTIIAIEMARLGQQRSRRTIENNQSVKGLAPWQMCRIRERLDAALEQGYPKIQELAHLCGLSRGHFMLMFKASTSLPLHRYVAEERFQAARRMLVQGQLGIKEIAAALGFCNTGHFTTAFRQMEGVTPSRYRSRSRADRADTSRCEMRGRRRFVPRDGGDLY